MSSFQTTEKKSQRNTGEGNNNKEQDGRSDNSCWKSKEQGVQRCSHTASNTLALWKAEEETLPFGTVYLKGDAGKTVPDKVIYKIKIRYCKQPTSCPRTGADCLYTATSIGPKNREYDSWAVQWIS